MITIARRHGQTLWETLVDPSRPNEDHFAAMDLHQGEHDPEFARIELHTTPYEAREFTLPPEPPVPPEPEFVADAFVGFEAGQIGELITLSQLAVGTAGPLAWSASATPPSFTTSGDTHSIIRPVHVSGGLCDGPSTGSLAVDHQVNNVAMFIGRFPVAKDAVSVSGFIKSSLPSAQSPNWVNYDLPTLYSASGQDFLVLQWRDGKIRAHGKRNPSGGPFIAVDRNRWYFFAMRWLRNGLGQVAIYDADTLALVGISEVPIGDNPTDRLYLGTNNHGGMVNAVTLFDNILIDWTTAKHPLGI